MKKNIISALFAFNLAGIFIFWWLGSSALLSLGTASILIALGRLAGLLAEYFILTELVLISRLTFIEREFGFDKLNKLHRWIGYGLLLGIASHPILLTLGYASTANIGLVAQLINFLTDFEDITKALIGLIILIAASLISIPVIRRMFKYETWHVSHLFMYAAIALVFGHQVNTGDMRAGAAFYYWYVLNFAVFGVLIFYRFLMPFILYWRHSFYVADIVKETHDVTSVYIGGRRMEEFTFRAGQYIHVSFLAKGIWQPHPFSLSADSNGKTIRLSIKSLGDYTSRIPTNLTIGTTVLLEGPFGKFTEDAATREKFLLIAGGIGITPIRALLESLSQKSRDIILIYANKTPADIAFKSEIDRLTKRVYHVLSSTTEPGYERGLVDEEKILRLSPDFRERDIYFCGPPAMADYLIKKLRKLGVPGSQLHYEKFSY